MSECECIVRMKYPESCQGCPVEVYGCCGITNKNILEIWGAYPKKRPPECPIIAKLPQNHGPLVDLKDLAKELDRIFAYETTDHNGMKHKEYPIALSLNPIRLSTIVPAAEGLK